MAEKPAPADWADDEHLTLTEAVAVFWPMGPLTVASLRTEIGHGRLVAEKIAGKLLVTPKELREMRQRCRVQVLTTSKPDEAGKPSKTAVSKSSAALAALMRRLERVKSAR